MSSGYGSKTYGANLKALASGGIQPGVLLHNTTSRTCEMQDAAHIESRLKYAMELVAKAANCDDETIAADPHILAAALKTMLWATEMVICGSLISNTVNRLYVSGVGSNARLYLWQDYASARSKTHIHLDNANLLSSAS